MLPNAISLSASDIELLETLVPAALLDALRRPEPAPAAVAQGCEQLALALTSLVPFIPAPALDLQLAAPSRSGGRGLPMHGTLLFADLSGFTALASRLATVGRRGGEEVGIILTQLFGALVAEIDLRGGRLLKFGGDTLTAFFHSAPLGGSHAAMAGAAALAMQERMNDFAAIPTSKGAFRLRLRIGIHSGTVLAVEVGDQRHMELVVTGSATHHVVKAQESAAPDEVIITRATREILGGARAEQKVSGMYLLGGLAEEPQAILATASVRQLAQPSAVGFTTLLEQLHALRAYLPIGLPSRFMRSDEAIGEFRPVTVLFVNFDAFSKLLTLVELPALMEHDLAIVGKVLNAYYMHIQTIVDRYGGNINKIDMATFGDRLMVLFGAPSAHEDDPHRAVRAALDIRARRKEINRDIVELLQDWTETHPDQRALLRVANMMLRQSIGIASGSVFAGIIGTPQRREYTVMGEAVQVAAHTLAAAQAGEIVLASLTRRAVHQVVETEPLPSIKLRHAARPVPIFRVLRPRGSADQAADLPAPISSLIGRRVELGQLVDLAQQALTTDGVAHIVAVNGEPGVGKSRLVEEALRMLRMALPDTRMIWETCQSYEQTSPYAAISQLFLQVLDVPINDDRAGQAAAVARQIELLAPSWSRFTPLIGRLLNLPIVDTALTRGLSVEQQRDRINDLLVHTFVAAAQHQPLVLVIDDLHWADASSQALVRSLAAELSGPLLLVLIYRRSPEFLEPWQELDNSSTLTLGELSHNDAEALLTALLGGSSPPELRPVIERSIGTPLFIEEIVRYMLESGAAAQRPRQLGMDARDR